MLHSSSRSSIGIGLRRTRWDGNWKFYVLLFALPTFLKDKDKEEYSIKLLPPSFDGWGKAFFSSSLGTHIFRNYNILLRVIHRLTWHVWPEEGNNNWTSFEYVSFPGYWSFEPRRAQMRGLSSAPLAGDPGFTSETDRRVAQAKGMNPAAGYTSNS